MPQFQIQNPDFEQVVHSSFASQGLLRHLGAVLSAVQPGEVAIELPFAGTLTQQDGFFHAGAVTAVVDTACGYAALTLMPPGSRVLTIEYKVNFLAPAQGTKLLAVGQVLKPGRTVTVCRGDVFMINGSNPQKLCATMLTSMIRK